MSKKFSRPKPYVQNISHDQNHMSKKFPMTRIMCPKNFHNQKHMSKKFTMTKIMSKKFPWTQKKKKSMSHNKKINAPPNFTTTKILDMSINNYQIFPITMPLEKISTWPCPCTIAKIPYPQKKISYPQNFSILIPTKFCHKLHMPTNLPHSSWFCSTKPTKQILHNFNAPQNSRKSSSNKYHKSPTLPKFFTTWMPTKFKPRLIQQHHKLPILPKFHKPPTLSRLHHDQKIQHFINAPKPTFPKHDQSHNALKISKGKIS